MQPKFVIEHLEKKLYKWCFLEYGNIAKIVGKGNIIFTNIKNKKELLKLKKLGNACKESVFDFKFNKNKTCVLDPNSKKTLTPAIARKFDYFIFGGILGNYPPEKRTKRLLTEKLKFESFNIGKKQMSTDNAVLAVKLIIDGVPLEKIKFKDNIKIKTGRNEEVILPYRYVVLNGKIFISEELIKSLKNGKKF
ncbi:MAG: SAM-dependent methyltransferase [Candidatus Woesearchaeota archaeon]|nr:SAM-dependent methyltransferase [Candidatus Woesearchaeota archaeon]